MTAKFKLPPAPPTACPGLCIDPDADNYNEEHHAAVLEAYAAAVLFVATETGRWGLCPIATRWCVPGGCQPCRCSSGCGHSLWLPLPGQPANGNCCNVFGEPLPGSNWAPFQMFCNGKPMSPALWRLEPNCKVRIDPATARQFCRPLDAWQTGKPTFDATAQAWNPPATPELVAVGFYGECPTAADLLRIKQLTCQWAFELAGLCDDGKEGATSVTQRGPDGSVTYRFDHKRVQDILAGGATGANSYEAPFGLTVITSPDAVIDTQNCEIEAA